jgi:hypothetical protein
MLDASPDEFVPRRAARIYHRGQALRFGWQPRKPQSTRLKLQYLHGTTVLTGEGGDKLACIRL